MSATLNITVKAGARYEAKLLMPARNGWRSLNDVTALCQVKTTPTSDTVVAVMTGTVTGETMSLVLAPVENNKLTPGVSYSWDLRLSWADGDVVFPISGSIKTTPSVSRP